MQEELPELKEFRLEFIESYGRTLDELLGTAGS
jgi:hypothetical protein